MMNPCTTRRGVARATVGVQAERRQALVFDARHERHDAGRHPPVGGHENLETAHEAVDVNRGISPGESSPAAGRVSAAHQRAHVGAAKRRGVARALDAAHHRKQRDRSSVARRGDARGCSAWVARPTPTMINTNGQNSSRSGRARCAAHTTARRSREAPRTHRSPVGQLRLWNPSSADADDRHGPKRRMLVRSAMPARSRASTTPSSAMNRPTTSFGVTSSGWNPATCRCSSSWRHDRMNRLPIMTKPRRTRRGAWPSRAR